jgi:hypothetical protein
VSTPLGYLSVFDELENSLELINQLRAVIDKGVILIGFDIVFIFCRCCYFCCDS